MPTNLDKFKDDLKSLNEQGEKLLYAMYYACYRADFLEQLRSVHGDNLNDFIESLPDFKVVYQRWYTECLALLKQTLPDRVDDFVRHYQKPKGRKDIDFENYRVEDYLQGLTITRGVEKKIVVDTAAAIPQFEQQRAIVQAATARFESSLFDIRQMVQADLLDSEVEAAEVLARHKFLRGAGAVAGVVIERHLAQVCTNHAIAIAKKNPTIADFNEALKSGGVIDVPQWRFIQHLADIRNLCDHAKAEPKPDQVTDLLEGTKKIIKTIY
jgi:hypothetical protein